MLLLLTSLMHAPACIKLLQFLVRFYAGKLRALLPDGVQGDGAGHKDVVVMPFAGAVAAVGMKLVDLQFMAGLHVAFLIGAVAHSPYQFGDYHLLGGTVCVESRAWHSAHFRPHPVIKV